MKHYLSSELEPGQFSTDFGGESHRVDPDPAAPPTFRDKLARLVSNAYSDQPGRLCLVKTDYRAADDVIAFFRQSGAEVPK